jgi:hypothetical protein
VPVQDKVYKHKHNISMLMAVVSVASTVVKARLRHQ